MEPSGREVSPPSAKNGNIAIKSAADESKTRSVGAVGYAAHWLIRLPAAGVAARVVAFASHARSARGSSSPLTIAIRSPIGRSSLQSALSALTVSSATSPQIRQRRSP
jgi:hypothetical protein